MPQGGRYIRIGTAVILAILIAGYAMSKSINLIEGSELSIDTPRNGETVNTNFISVTGVAKNVAFLTLNDRQIFTDDSGNISEKLLLYEGYNIITIRARDKFGREKVVVREIIYKP